MAYDFSKNKVSVSELNQKKKDAVAASRSSNKSSSTPATSTPSATKSDTWNKDTVTLAEAKQQTKDVQSGVIDLDTGSTSVELAAPKETISLEQAKQQTTTEVRPATNTSAAKTTEYVNDAGDVVATKVENTSYVPIKAGSGVRQSAETVTTVKKSGDVAVIEAVDNPQRKSELSVPVATVPDIDPLYSQKVQEAAINLNASIDKDKVFQEMGGSTTMNYTPEQRASVMQENMEIDISEYKTEKDFNSSQSYAAKVVTKGDSLVGKLVDTDVKIAKTLHIDGAIAKTGVTSGGVKDFVGGAVVDNVAGVVVGLGAAPVAIEATFKDTDKVLPAVTTGAAIMAKDIGANLINPETRARTSGQLVGAIVAEKVAMKTITVYDDITRTATRTEIPIEGLAKPEVIANPDVVPTVAKGTSIDTVLDNFSEAKYRHPDAASLPKHSDIIVENYVQKTIPSELQSNPVTVKEVKSTPMEVMADTYKNDLANTVYSDVNRNSLTDVVLGKTGEKVPIESIDKYAKANTDVLVESENMYGIHVSPGDLGEITRTRVQAKPRKTDMYGLYTGPDASLHFAEVSNKRYGLIGLSTPDSSPTINFIQMAKGERIPEALRHTDKNTIAGARDFMVNDARKGVGYTTPKLETRILRKSAEQELVIPPDTMLIRDQATSRYYTKINGRRIPVNVYETIPEGVIDGKRVVSNIDETTLKKAKVKDYSQPEYRSPKEALIDQYSSMAMLGGSSGARTRKNRYAPNVTGYTPKSNGYKPKNSEYTPKTSGYTPKSSNYIPKSSRYLPKSSGYTPKPDNYTPKPETYLPKTDSYVPKPKSDNNYPISGIELPNNKRRSRRGKDNRFKSQYDRLYNQYGDISKWRGF